MLYAILIRRIRLIHATFVLARLTANRRPIRWARTQVNTRWFGLKWKVAPPSLYRKRRTMTTQLLYTVEQAAQVLAISRSSVYRLIANREIVSLEIGRCRRISHQAIEGFIKGKTKSEYSSW